MSRSPLLFGLIAFLLTACPANQSDNPTGDSGSETGDAGVEGSGSDNDTEAEEGDANEAWRQFQHDAAGSGRTAASKTLPSSPSAVYQFAWYGAYEIYCTNSDYAGHCAAADVTENNAESAANHPHNIAVDADENVYFESEGILIKTDVSGAVIWTADLTDDAVVPENTVAPNRISGGDVALASDDGSVYTGEASTVFKFDGDGNFQWSWASTASSFEGIRIADDGTLYVYTIGSFTPDSACTSSGTSCNSGSGTCDDHSHCVTAEPLLVALNPDGSESWSVTISGSAAPFTTPTFDESESYLFLGTGDGNRLSGGYLLQLEADGGAAVGSEFLFANSGRSSAPFVTATDLFASKATAIEKHSWTASGIDSAPAWSYAPTGGAVASSLIGIVDTANGIVYWGVRDTASSSSNQTFYLTALDADSGSLLSRFETGINCVCTTSCSGGLATCKISDTSAECENDVNKPIDYGLPTNLMLDAEGNVLFGSYDCRIYSAKYDADSSSITVNWSYETGGYIHEVGGAIDGLGTAYFVSSDGYVYGI